METILTILGIIFLIVIVCYLLLVLPYIIYFYRHSCKHCGHSMEYKGLKEDNDGGHYLFQCPHCGAWEQIPKSTLLKNFIYKDYDPLNE